MLRSLAIVALAGLLLRPSTGDAPPPESLASPTGPGASAPHLSVAPDGRVLMSWLEPADSGFALRFAALTAESWSQPRTIRRGGDFFVNWADIPSVRMAASGQLIAHWLQRTGTSPYAYGVRVSRSRDGGRTWSDPVVLHRDNSDNEHGFVAIWPERAGFGAAWLDGRNFKAEGHDAGNEMLLLSTSISPTGALGSERVLDARVCDCCQNDAAVTARGPVVVYRNRSADEIRDIYITRRINGRWLRGRAVHDDNWKIAACPVNGPAVAAAGNRVAVSWFTAADDQPRVNVALSTDAGATFRRVVRVDGGQPAGRVDIALLRNGGALVSWIERTGGDTAEVRVRVISASGRAGRPASVAASSAARASGFPQMEIAGSHVVFAWTVAGRPSEIRVARMDLAELERF